MYGIVLQVFQADPSHVTQKWNNAGSGSFVEETRHVDTIEGTVEVVESEEEYTKRQNRQGQL